MTFDLWFTLLAPSDDERADTLRAARLLGILRSAGLDLGYQEVRSAVVAARDETFKLQRGRGMDLNPPGQLQFVLARLGVASGVGEGLFRALLLAYETVLFDVEPRVMPGAEEALSQAWSRGVRCGLICNTGATPGWVVRHLLRRKGLDRFFRCMLFSDEVGVAKPSRQIFEMALSSLGASPGEAVHVGDDPVFDLQGGIGAGMSVVWLNSRGLERPLGMADAGAAAPASLLGTVGSLSDLGGVVGW